MLKPQHLPFLSLTVPAPLPKNPRKAELSKASAAASGVAENYPSFEERRSREQGVGRGGRGGPCRVRNPAPLHPH